MEEHTRALEIVCQHFRHEYMSEDISKHRKALRRVYQRNSRLRAEKDAQHIELMMLKKKIQRLAVRNIHDAQMSARIYRLILK